MVSTDTSGSCPRTYPDSFLCNAPESIRFTIDCLRPECIRIMGSCSGFCLKEPGVPLKFTNATDRVFLKDKALLVVSGLMVNGDYHLFHRYSSATIIIGCNTPYSSTLIEYMMWPWIPLKVVASAGIPDNSGAFLVFGKSTIVGHQLTDWCKELLASWGYVMDWEYNYDCNHLNGHAWSILLLSTLFVSY